MTEEENYTATLIGLDGFTKKMKIKDPIDRIYIPKIEKVNVYFGDPILSSMPVKQNREFYLSIKKSWKKELIYEEV